MTGRRLAAPLAAALALAAVLGVAARARLAGGSDALSTGELVPVVDGDAAYHLRRILHAVEHFPSLPTVDPAMSWPRGAACPWADGFDLLGAALARAAGGKGDPARAAVAAALLPPILGLLVAWAAMDLARRVGRRGRGAGRRATGLALAAGLGAALLPQAVSASRFARTDHHVAEALAMVLLAGWALRRPGAERPAVARAGFELAGAAAATFACWTFTGGPLYVALAAPLVLAAVLRERAPRLAGSGAPALLAAAAATALLHLPALRQHGRLVSFQHPSLLQPLLVALAGVILALAVLVSRRAPAARPAGRLLRLAALGAGAAALAGAAAPAAARELAAGLSGWLLRGDPWLASVLEFQPVWGGGRGLGGGLATFLGWPGPLAPALVAAGGWWAGRRAGARGRAFAALSATLLALALFQVRFGRVLAPFLAVNLALAAEAGAWLALRAARRGRRLGVATAAAVALLALADPHQRELLRTPPGAPPAPEVEAALALRRAPAGPAEPAPGVLATWGHGHVVSLLSGRPVVVNGFGPYLEEETFWRLQRLAALGAAELDALLEERRVGFVVTGAPYLGREAFADSPAGKVLAPEAMRRLPASTLAIAGSGLPDAGVPHLPHLMPVFASSATVPGLAFPLPWLWAYERVPGARLAGRAAPGARVVVAIPFVERGRSHLYRAWADAGSDGRFEVVVPLPTGLARPALRTGPAASVRIGGAAPVALAVPEAAVRRGAVLEVAPPRPR